MYLALKYSSETLFHSMKETADALHLCLEKISKLELSQTEKRFFTLEIQNTLKKAGTFSIVEPYFDPNQWQEFRKANCCDWFEKFISLFIF